VIADECEVSEDVLLDEVRALERLGVLKRICGMVNYSALGRISVLVAGRIPEEKLNQVISSVNLLGGVSHNYLRDHEMNLWFTLQTDSSEKINRILSGLALDHGVRLISLPAKQTFKLRAVFGGFKDSAKRLSGGKIYTGEPIQLNSSEKYILERVSEPLEIVSRPFDSMCMEDIDIAGVIEIIESLCERGVIRRISGILDQRKLGYGANVLFAADISKRLKTIGKEFAKLDIVTHCYERYPADGWPYNFYAMTHAKTIDGIKELLEPIIEKHHIEHFQYLPTIRELKKQPVKLKFDE
jgi:DNA-binding Lrp family transcriptional regulator